MKDLKGKVCVVTGAARSIGLAIAQSYADAGARVAIIDIDPTVEAAAEKMRDGGADAKAYVLDITSRDAVMACFRDIAESLGPVYCLVNNAGVVDQSPVDQISTEQLDRMFKVNVYGTVFCSQGAMVSMRGLGDGRIINFSSKSGKTGSALMGAYSAAKGAVIALTHAMAFELASDNIKVNCICPGITDATGVWSNVSAGYTDNLKMPREEVVAKFTSKIPLGRLTAIEDVAEFVHFLTVSGDYCTGQAFNITGGREVH